MGPQVQDQAGPGASKIMMAGEPQPNLMYGGVLKLEPFVLVTEDSVELMR